MAYKDIALSQPRLLVTLNNVSIPQDAISTFEFEASEDSPLPRCVIRFNDKGNARINDFYGLEFGSDVVFKIYDAEQDNAKLNDTNSYTLTPLTVAAVHSTQQQYSGFLEVLCEHPWRAFNDASQHAYLGEPNSEIIKSICINSSGRGFSFADFDSEIFLASDDNGETPRYKTGEDLDFIMNDLLPFTTINKSPAKFWIDERNRMHLNSFQNMFMAESRLMVVQGNKETVAEEKLEDRMSSMKGVVFTKSPLLKVGDTHPDQIISILKTNVSFDDPSSQMTFSGTLLPKVAISKYKANSKTQAGYVPVSLRKMVMQDSLAKKFYRHYPLDDMKSYALNEQQRFNSFFEIETETTFGGQAVTTGDNVDFFMPAMKVNGASQVSWMNGKWHVKSVKYRWNAADAQLTMVLRLIRPSFMTNSKTSILSLDSMYSVGMTV